MRLSQKKEANVFLFSNRLSCHLPRCSDNATANMSLAAIGNQLRLPGTFPSWVAPMEHSKLFWTSGAEGCFLLFKAVAASLVS